MQMDGYSITPQEERLKALRSLMPEVFNEGKIDWEKLKATLGENINFSNERYVLNWAGKSDAFRVMQQPSSATAPRVVFYSASESVMVNCASSNAASVMLCSLWIVCSASGRISASISGSAIEGIGIKAKEYKEPLFSIKRGISS